MAEVGFATSHRSTAADTCRARAALGPQREPVACSEVKLSSAADRLRSDHGTGALDDVIAAAAHAEDAEVARLAQVLAGSGATLGAHPDAVDVASTGGPSSLSTLVVPLQLGASGSVIPKLGVPGRPAGGVDVLATVPGYRVTMSAEEVRYGLMRSPVIHVAAAEFAPLDAALFARRQETGAQAVTELVIASLLSKKLAMGLCRAALDVRVSAHGNFGATWDSARRNAARFCSVAALVGIDAVCVLTDASVPYQALIGRGEALVALADVLAGRPDDWLESHENDCWKMVAAVRPSAERPSAAQLARVFACQLEAHGTSSAAFDDRVDAVRREPTLLVTAPSGGFAVVDLEAMRDAIVAAQTDAGGSPFPDPVGVRLLTRPDEHVSAGTPLAEVRRSATVGTAAVERIAASITIGQSEVARRPLEIVRA